MNRQQFFFRLNSGLKILPRNERKEIVKYYNEIFDDKIEDGLTEEEIIMQLGELDDIIANSLNYDKSGETGSKYVRVDDEYVNIQKSKDRRKTLLIVAACTFYIWLPIVLGLGAGILGAIIGIVGAAFSFVVSGFACILAGSVATVFSVYTMFVNLTIGICNLGASLSAVGVGLIILWCSKVAFIALKKLVISTKSKLCKKEREHE